MSVRVQATRRRTRRVAGYTVMPRSRRRAGASSWSTRHSRKSAASERTPAKSMRNEASRAGPKATHAPSSEGIRVSRVHPSHSPFSTRPRAADPSRTPRSPCGRRTPPAHTRRTTRPFCAAPRSPATTDGWSSAPSPCSPGSSVSRAGSRARCMRAPPPLLSTPRPGEAAERLRLRSVSGRCRKRPDRFPRPRWSRQRACKAVVPNVDRIDRHGEGC